MAAVPGNTMNPKPLADRSEFARGPWPKVLLLVIILGMVAGFIAGFWVGIMGLCFGAALIATLPLK